MRRASARCHAAPRPPRLPAAGRRDPVPAGVSHDNLSMGLFQKFKDGLHKTQAKLFHEIKRIVTLSPKLTGSTLEELEAALLGADLGMAMTQQIVGEVKKGYETQGRSGLQIFEIAQREVEKALSANQGALRRQPAGLTVVSIVGVNGTGKTTTSAKLAHWLQGQGHP